MFIKCLFVHVLSVEWKSKNGKKRLVPLLKCFFAHQDDDEEGLFVYLAVKVGWEWLTDLVRRQIWNDNFKTLTNYYFGAVVCYIQEVNVCVRVCVCVCVYVHMRVCVWGIQLAKARHQVGWLTLMRGMGDMWCWHNCCKLYFFIS